MNDDANLASPPNSIKKCYINKELLSSGKKRKLPKIKKKVEFKLEVPESTPRRDSTKGSTANFSDFLSLVKIRRKSTIRDAVNKNPDDGIRRDAYGTEIAKNSKSHKVTFIDIVSNKNLVEYGYIQKYIQNSEDEARCNCNCLII